MGLSIWHILVVVAVVAVLFGAGKIPRLARDLGSGINAFKNGLREGDDEARRAETMRQPVAADDPRQAD